MICGALPKTLSTCSPLLINKNIYLCFGFCDITAELVNKGLCSWPRRTASRTPNPKGDQVPRLTNPGMKPIAFKVLLRNTCPYWILLPQMLRWLVDGPSTLAKADRTLSGPTQHHCRRLCSLPALQCLQISQSLQHLPPTRTSLTLSVRIGQTRAELLFNIWPWFCSERTRTSSSTRQCKLSL